MQFILTKALRLHLHWCWWSHTGQSVLAMTAVETALEESAETYETQQHGELSLRSARGQPESMRNELISTESSAQILSNILKDLLDWGALPDPQQQTQGKIHRGQSLCGEGLWCLEQSCRIYSVIRWARRPDLLLLTRQVRALPGGQSLYVQLSSSKSLWPV